MFEVLGFIPFLLIIAVLSTAVYLIFSKKETGSTESPNNLVRRLYFYSITFVGLLMTVAGTVQIIQFILEGIGSNNVVQQSPEKVALGVSLIVVGAPLWGFHWHLINRNLADNINERISGIRKVFVYSILFLSLAVLTNAIYQVLQTIFGYKDSAYYQIAVLVPYLGIWVLHWRINSREGFGSYAGVLLLRIYLYSASVIGLTLMATGAGGIINALLQTGYDSAAGVPLILEANGGEWVDTVTKPLPTFLTGVLLWSTHWLLLARADSHNRIRATFLYLTAIPVGGLISMSSSAILINAILGSLLGIYGDESPPFLAISSILVGFLIIFYHWRVIRLESSNTGKAAHLPSDQVFTYGFSFIGLLFAGPGIAILVYSILTFFWGNPGEILNSNTVAWREPIVAGLTGLMLGGSVWLFCRRKLVHIWSDSAINVTTLARIYYIAILGIGLIAVTAALSALIYLLLTHILASKIGYETLQSIRIPLSLIVAFALIVPYHWLENRRIPSIKFPNSVERVEVQKIVTIITPQNSEFFLEQLEQDLGYPVQTRRWADIAASEHTFHIDTTESIAAAIQTSPGANVIVIAEQGGAKIYSYD